MPRYILIDHDTGYVWGDTGDLDGPARQETPLEAARRLDLAYGETDRAYTEHAPDYRPPSLRFGAASPATSAYHVYRADLDGSEVVPIIWDGQSREAIEAVEALCRKVAVVESIAQSA